LRQRVRRHGRADLICSAVFLAGAALMLAACAHGGSGGDGDGEVNAYPTDYKLEILAAMHAYLNDPTGVRDAAMAPPLLEPIGKGSLFSATPPTHYVVCLRFNGKKNATEYAGPKELAAVFMSGRFDHFIETPKEQCAGAAYAPFPELQNLTR
jgi:hypothetical protein